MKANTQQKEILTEDELAELLSCSGRTLQRARLDGRNQFPFLIVADRALYARSAVLEVFASQAATTASVENRPRKVDHISTAHIRGRGRPRKIQPGV